MREHTMPAKKRAKVQKSSHIRKGNRKKFAFSLEKLAFLSRVGS